MIVLTAIIHTAEGKGDAVETEFKKLVPMVLKDPGAIAYALHRAVDDPNKFLVYEIYENQAALDYHRQTEHFKAFGLATKGMYAARAEISYWNKVA